MKYSKRGLLRLSPRRHAAADARPASEDGPSPAGAAGSDQLPPFASEAGSAADPEVYANLHFRETQRPVGSLRNVSLILSQDRHWAGRLQWSEFEGTPLLDGRPVRDADLDTIEIWLADNYLPACARGTLWRAVNFVARKQPVHGPRDWLRSLVWDRQPRLDGLLATYFGAEDAPLHRKFSACWLIGACARVFTPGCQLDTMLVLIGEQGVGKSRACAALVPDRAWFGDTPFDIGKKDGFVNLRGKWFYELPELETLRRVGDEARKAFITSRVDRYRAPHGRVAEDHPRQVVFIATTNCTEFLTDPTGARRYWPVVVGTPSVDQLEGDRAQLFAEAVLRYDAGEPWHLDPESAALLHETHRSFQVQDPWEGLLSAWVAEQSEAFTVEDALRDALHLAPASCTARNRQRAGVALSRMGCTRTRPRVKDSGRPWRWLRPKPVPDPDA